MDKSKRPDVPGAIWPSTGEGLAHALLLSALIDLFAQATPKGFRGRLLETLEETLERVTFYVGDGDPAPFAQVKIDALGRLRTLLAEPEGGMQ